MVMLITLLSLGLLLAEASADRDTQRASGFPPGTNSNGARGYGQGFSSDSLRDNEMIKVNSRNQQDSNIVNNDQLFFVSDRGNIGHLQLRDDNFRVQPINRQQESLNRGNQPQFGSQNSRRKSVSLNQQQSNSKNNFKILGAEQLDAEHANHGKLGSTIAGVLTDLTSLRQSPNMAFQNQNGQDHQQGFSNQNLKSGRNHFPSTQTNFNKDFLHQQSNMNIESQGFNQIARRKNLQTSGQQQLSRVDSVNSYDPLPNSQLNNFDQSAPRRTNSLNGRSHQSNTNLHGNSQNSFKRDEFMHQNNKLGNNFEQFSQGNSKQDNRRQQSEFNNDFSGHSEFRENRFTPQNHEQFGNNFGRSPQRSSYRENENRSLDSGFFSNGQEKLWER